MSHVLTIKLSDGAYNALRCQAAQSATSPNEVAASALEQRFGPAVRPAVANLVADAARARFESHFGEVDMGHATGISNESIDADLARAFADPHEDS